MNRKFLIVVSIVFSVVTGLWIWTLASPKNVINVGGSASVDPIMQRATNKYTSDDDKSFVYSSTGSTSGINNLKSQVYEIGFISKEVKPEDFDKPVIEIKKDTFDKSKDEFKKYFQETENIDKYHYVNFADDAIVFIYNVKDTAFAPFADLFSFLVGDDGHIQDNEILKKIYEVDSQDEIIKWSAIAEILMLQNGLMQKSEWQENLAALKANDIDVTPYASTPGSGTLTSFKNLTGVNPGRAVNRYGNNGSTFAQISRSSGAFGFVNLAFAREIAKSRFKNLRTVIITNKAGDIWNIGEEPEIPSDKPYPLIRKFFALFYNDQSEKGKKRTETILDFIYWFATDPSLAEDYKDEGLLQVMVKTETAKIKNYQTDEVKIRKVENR